MSSPSEVAHPAGQRAAAEYLRGLLLKPGPYMEVWQQHLARPRQGVINQLAVAEVIAAHLRSAPSGPGDANVLSYQLRETVADALSGRLVSRRTLSLFIDAFGISEHEASRLWRLWRGSAMISVVSGSHAVPSGAEHELTNALGPRLHQTLSLHDHVYVCKDGRIDRARTLQVVEGITPGADRLPFLCDTNVLTLEVGQGCKGVTGEVRAIGDRVFATEILLAKALQVGETISLEYWITYRFPGDPRDPDERQYRRAVMREIENVDMRVEFHPHRMPAHVWWARWDGIEGGILDQQEMSPDSQHSVHRYLRSVEKTVAGFYWEWQ